MQFKVLNDQGERTFALIFETGEEVMSRLTAFAREQGLRASRFTAIGAFSDVVLGYFDWEKKDYERMSFDEQLEVLSVVGDIAREDDEAKVHAHIVLGRRDGTTRGGHLLEGRVRPTLEVMLTESPSHLKRVHDPVSGLALIDMGSSPRRAA
jgi:predicted DNA-binding protein with PD1-like motif